jgi:hypothetical protein
VALSVENYYIVTVGKQEDGSSIIRSLSSTGYSSYQEAAEVFSDIVVIHGLEEDVCTIICDMQPEKGIEIKGFNIPDDGIDTQDGVHYVKVLEVGDSYPAETAEKLKYGVHQTYGVILPDIVAVVAPSGMVFSEEDMQLFKKEGCEPYFVLMKDHGDDWEIVERSLH